MRPRRLAGACARPLNFTVRCPLSLPSFFPFTALRVPEGEEVLWFGYNPTFHRCFEYGLALTTLALYLCRRSWWRLAHWERIPLDDVIAVDLLEGGFRPGLTIQRRRRMLRFHTPFDVYRDEVAHDRRVLEEGVNAIRAAKSGSQTVLSDP